MRKAKLLPSILMLILCVGVLAVGIYAAAPVSHSINGTINVSAAGAEVKIGVYLDSTAGAHNGVLISNEPTTRTTETLNITAGKLAFNCDDATTVEDVSDKYAYIKIQNNSSINLGAYFPVGEVASTGATAANVASVKNLNGTTTDGTLNDVVKCSFGPYTLIEAGKTAYIDMNLSLEKLSHFSAVEVELDLSINLENYNSNLAALANGVNVYTNATGATISTQTVTYGQTAGTALTATGIGYSVSALKLDEGNFNTAWGTDVKKNETTKLTFTVSNTGSAAVAADININNASYRSTELVVTELSNAYIPAGGTGEVSIQFTPTTTISDYTLDDICIDVDIYPATSDATAQANIKSRIQKVDAGKEVGGMAYYIEYGTNPYTGTPLRWFIWGKSATNSGTAVALGNTNPMTETGKLNYYFISEYILDVSGNSDASGNFGLSFQNNLWYDDNNYTYYNMYANADEDEDTTPATQVAVNYSSDYAGSNYRNYMTGLTTKRTAAYATNSSGTPTYYTYTASGDVINFYDRFNLTNDALYSLISARSVAELYTNDSDYSQSAPDTRYNGDSDKFWALSYSEVSVMGWGNNAVAYRLSSTTSSDYWWLRSPDRDYSEFYVSYNGFDDYISVRNNYVGSRPAFKIQI